MRRTFVALGVVLIAGVLGGCGGDDGDDGAASETSTSVAEATTTSTPATDGKANPISIEATEYSFQVADEVKGGLVEFVFANRGKEAHFAGLAQVLEGKTYEDAKAFLTSAPPEDPPPFVEFAGAATIDPGGNGDATFNLPAGTYALFCAIPAPDGIPHVGKGMIKPLMVTEGIAGTMPESATTLTAKDFSLAGSPPSKAGAAVVGISNQGKQIHEVNLVELAAGKKIDDVVAWFKAPTGPPPMSFRDGVAVAAGEEGTSTWDLKSGSTYAIICAVPDSLSGDFVPHIVKGMYTAAFTIS
ncbi:MAG: hypothetical protein ACRDZ3_22895 [Acidimicrobiia bacterium]